MALTSVALLGDRLSSLVLSGVLLFLLSSPHTTTDRFGIQHTDAVTDLSATPSIRLGAVAYYPTAADAPPSSPLSAAVQGMAWFGMGVPGLSRRSLWVALVLEIVAVLVNLSTMVSVSANYWTDCSVHIISIAVEFSVDLDHCFC